MDTTPVDVEAILSQFLRDQPEIVTIVGQRVFTDLPNASDRTYPLVLLTRVGSAFVARNYLETVSMRLDCYGTNHGQARALATTCMWTISGRLAGRYPSGGVVAVGCIISADYTSLVYEPDGDSADESGHARPRYVAHVDVRAHP